MASPPPNRRRPRTSSPLSSGRVTLAEAAHLLSTSIDRRLASTIGQLPGLEGVSFQQTAADLEAFTGCASADRDVEGLLTELEASEGFTLLSRSELMNIAESPLQMNASIVRMLLIADSKTFDKPAEERTKIENKLLNRVSKAERKRLIEICEAHRTVSDAKEDAMSSKRVKLSE